MNFLFHIFAFLLYSFFSFYSFATLYTPLSVYELIYSMNNAQTNGQNDIIDLGGNIFTLTAVDNSNGGLGANGLPYVNEAGFSLTIRNGEIRRAASAPRFRFILNGSTLNLEGVTFRNGFAERGTSGATRGGAIFNLKDIPLINNCQFIANQVEGNSFGSIWKEALGGAIAVYKGSIGKITNSLFDNNLVIAGISSSQVSAIGLGGAISIEYSGTIDTISNTTFSNNKAIGSAANAADSGIGGKAIGGAIGIYFASKINVISLVKENSFINNQAIGGEADFYESISKFAGSAYGGAIGAYKSKSSINNITQNNFDSNKALGGSPDFGYSAFAGDAFGGAIYSCPNFRLNRISFTNFIANQAQGLSGVLSQKSGNAFGGAIALEGSEIGTILSSTFDSNKAFGGDNLSLSSNDSIAKGGAVYMSASSASPGVLYNLYDSTYSNNKVQANDSALGGAIFVEGNVNTESFISYINNVTFSSNTAGHFGGAISLGLAAAIYDFGSSTIANNQVLDNAGGGGIYLNKNSRIDNFFSNIVALNRSGVGPLYQDIQISIESFIFNNSHNLIGVDTGHNIINGNNNNQVGTTAFNLDPLLGELQNNGGFTATHALLPGSPAINTGLNFYYSSNDQRGLGFIRTVGEGTDIGAFELQ